MILSKNKNKILITPIVFGVIIILTTIIFVALDADPYFPWLPVKPDGEIVYTQMHRVLGPIYDLFYFTFQTNIILGIALITFGVHYSNHKVQTLLTIAVSYISVTFIIFWTAIAPISQLYKWQSPYWVINNVFMHFINPLYGIIYFGFKRKDIVVNSKIIQWSSLYLPAFCIQAAILYAVGSETVQENSKLVFKPCYIYKFLDFKNPLFLQLEVNGLQALAYLIDIIIIIVSPLLSLVFSKLYTKALKIKVEGSIFSFFKKEQTH